MLSTSVFPLRRTWSKSVLPTGPLHASPPQPQPSLPLNGFPIQHALKSWKRTPKSIKLLRKGFEIHGTGFLCALSPRGSYYGAFVDLKILIFQLLCLSSFLCPYINIYIQTHFTFLQSIVFCTIGSSPQFSHIPTKDTRKCPVLVWRG